MLPVAFAILMFSVPVKFLNVSTRYIAAPTVLSTTVLITAFAPEVTPYRDWPTTRLCPDVVAIFITASVFVLKGTPFIVTVSPDSGKPYTGLARMVLAKSPIFCEPIVGALLL